MVQYLRTRPLPSAIICVDFGGSRIRVSVAEANITKRPNFRLISKWPGRSGHSEFVPNLVVRWKETCEQPWGYSAQNALSDQPSKYQAHYDLKRFLLNHLESTIDFSAVDKRASMLSACLTLINGILRHALGSRHPESLTVVVGVPTLINASGANHFLETWPLASSIDVENTTILVADEAEMGGMGMRSSEDQIATHLNEYGEEYTLIVCVNFGSTTMDVTIFWSGESILAESLDRGFDEINKVVRESTLSPHDKLILEEKLESRKGNVRKWCEAIPNGPLGPGKQVPDLMLELKDTEDRLIRFLVNGLKRCVEPVLNTVNNKMLIELWGGPAGSEPLNEHIREELEGNRIAIKTSDEATYSCQPVLTGLEMFATDRRRANTAPIRYDVFLSNHAQSSDRNRPLLLWDCKEQKLSPPFAMTLCAQGKAEDTTELTTSFELFRPSSSKKNVHTRRITKTSMRVAGSGKGLVSTGKCDVTLPITAMEASIYVFCEMFGYTLTFVVVFRKDGSYISELENTNIKVDDVFEEGLFYRLREEFRKDGMICFRKTARVILPGVIPLKDAAQQTSKPASQEPTPNHAVIENLDDGDSDVEVIQDEDVGNMAALTQACRQKRSASHAENDGPNRKAQKLDQNTEMNASMPAPASFRYDKIDDDGTGYPPEKFAMYLRHKVQRFLEQNSPDDTMKEEVSILLEYAHTKYGNLGPEILQSTKARRAINEALRREDLSDGIKESCRSLLKKWDNEGASPLPGIGRSFQ